MVKKKMIISGVCVLAAAAVVGGLVLGKGGTAQTLVSTELLQQMDLQNTVSLTGVVDTENGRKVYSTLSYLVESVNVEVGDTVEEGDVLAKLKTSDLELDIAQQQAAVDASNSQAAHQIEVSRKAYENAKENYENGLDSSAISADQSVTQADYSVEQAKQQLESAKAAVSDAQENYRITRDQLNGNVTSAEEALRDAKDALSEAQSAYDSAVAGQQSALEQAKQTFEQQTADYQAAKAEWTHLEQTYLTDIQLAVEAKDEAIQAVKKYEEEHPKETESDEYKNLLKAQSDAEDNLKNKRETYVQQKSIFQNIQDGYNQAMTDYQSQVASISSSSASAQSGVAAAQSGVATAEAQLDAAKDAQNGASVAQLEQGIDSAKRGVESAALQKEQAEDQADSAEQLRDATNNQIEQQIETLQDSLISSQLAAESNRSQEIAIEKLQNTLDEATITAPVSGVVTAVYAKVGEPGNGLLFVIEDTESLKVTTYIKEYDIGNITEGMKVTIKSDATGDKEIPGTITYIAPAAVKTDTGATKTTDNNSTVEFEAEVQVDEQNSGLRIGMNTRLTVLVDERDDVYGVPYDSVVEKADGTQVLYVAEPQSSEGKDTYVVTEVPVTTGLETDFYVEVSGDSITDGMIVLSDPQSVTVGSEVTPDFVAAGEPVVGLSSESGE
ncbi:HlyD family efflux transporter periplasmic adaptor subunit [uncultured Negativibacillus sp.]|uniref:HlyD family efflux transporter periplasmic adaptor subunit n=1 Tax=uncultured Negativibacillus sp. TaxID=1980696 RepID=UPI0025DAB207|nr:HlyD family efflux transporter periplasmic adaptor subunit [uncultured Negativibacillus sp.]